MKKPRHQSRLVIVAALALLAVIARANDWPQWRGLNGEGVWHETSILESIPNTGLEIRWRARIGAGYSGPVVAQKGVSS